MKKLSLILIILLLSIGIFVITYLKNLSQFAKPIGKLQTTKNEKLQANINKFMESQKSEYVLGRDNYFCSNHLYGYDEQYAYAWVYCSGLIIKSNSEIEQGSAFSAPTRLEYKSPDFKIISYKRPGDGTFYTTTFKKLFPKQLYDLAINQSSLPEIQKMNEEIRSKIKK